MAMRLQVIWEGLEDHRLERCAVDSIAKPSRAREFSESMSLAFRGDRAAVDYQADKHPENLSSMLALMVDTDGFTAMKRCNTFPRIDFLSEPPGAKSAL